MFISRRLSKPALIVNSAAGTTLDTGDDVGQIVGVNYGIKFARRENANTGARLPLVVHTFRGDKGRCSLSEVIRHQASFRPGRVARGCCVGSP